jgi:hypothetical protein
VNDGLNRFAGSVVHDERAVGRAQPPLLDLIRVEHLDRHAVVGDRGRELGPIGIPAPGVTISWSTC